MKTKMIALKRAKQFPIVKKTLPADFIVEFADISLFPEGHFNPRDGYEIMTEKEFIIDYEKNQERLDKFNKHKLDLQMKREKALKAVERNLNKKR